MGFRYLTILSDLFHGKVSISQLRNMKTTLETLQKITKLQKIKFRHLELLNRQNLTDCCNLYNTYTTGQKIPIETIFKDLDWVIQKIEAMASSGSPISSILFPGSGFSNLTMVATMLRGFLK